MRATRWLVSKMNWDSRVDERQESEQGAVESSARVVCVVCRDLCRGEEGKRSRAQLSYAQATSVVLAEPWLVPRFSLSLKERVAFMAQNAS